MNILADNTHVGFDFKNLTKETLHQYIIDIKHQVNNAINQVVLYASKPRTFENTCKPLIDVGNTTEPLKGSFCYAMNFYPSEEIINVATECEKEINKFMIDAFMNKDLYKAFNEYHEGNYKNEKNRLTLEENRYVEHELRDYKRLGLHLPDEEFNMVKEMSKRLSDLGTEFSDNVNKDNTFFMLTLEELEGMPKSWFSDKKPDGSNKYKITMKYPDYVPASEYVKSESVRKRLFDGYNSRCVDTNIGIFKEAITLRYKLAKLLGYKHHADYVTEVKIVKNAQTAYDFLMNLNQKFEPIYDKEMKELLTFAQNYSENPLNKNYLDAWDMRYYIRAFKEVQMNLDMEEVKKYFPYNKVRDGLFQIYQTMLGLKFETIVTDNKWHSDVELIAVKDKQTDELMGYFYLDMHPRDNKYGHAAAFDFITGYEINKPNKLSEGKLSEGKLTEGKLSESKSSESKPSKPSKLSESKPSESKHKRAKVDNQPIKTRQPHVLTVACNFPQSGCISYDDVQTFFHEFGHVMHQICSRPQLKSFSGFHVENDFVEAPSQMLEFWCFQKVPLQMMSSHEETGKPIPEDIINKLKKMEKLSKGYHYKRQLMFSVFDLKVHMLTFEDNKIFDSQALWYETEHDIMKYDARFKLNPVATFGHFMSGYDAGYYGYLRSETFATNMFYQKFKDHEIDPKVGMEYRTKLLQPGSSRDGMDLLRDFLGKEPSDDDFLRDNGLMI